MFPNIPVPMSMAYQLLFPSQCREGNSAVADKAAAGDDNQLIHVDRSPESESKEDSNRWTGLDTLVNVLMSEMKTSVNFQSGGD